MQIIVSRNELAKVQEGIELVYKEIERVGLEESAKEKIILLDELATAKNTMFSSSKFVGDDFVIDIYECFTKDISELYTKTCVRMMPILKASLPMLTLLAPTMDEIFKDLAKVQESYTKPF